MWFITGAFDILLVAGFFIKRYISHRWLTPGDDYRTGPWYKSPAKPIHRNSSISSVHSFSGALGDYHPRKTGAFSQNMHESYKDALVLGSVHDGEESEGSVSPASGVREDV